MNIGEIRVVNGRLEGSLETLTVYLPRIRLHPVESMNPKAPAYEIMALNVARRWVVIGRVWKANSRKTGEEFLAGNIDELSLPLMPLAFFPTENGNYAIAWRRESVRSDLGGSGSDFGAANYDRVEPVGGSNRYPGGEGGFGDSTAGPDGGFGGLGSEGSLEDDLVPEF